MKPVFFLFPAILLTLLLSAQQSLTSLPAGDWASAHADSKFGNALSGSVNPAALAWAERVMTGVYNERRFLLKALSLSVAGIVIPVKSGGVGLAVHYFGGPDFNISAIGLGYGKRLGRRFGLGAQVSYHTTHLAGYGSFHTFTFKLGTVFRVTDRVQLSVYCYNPLRGSFGLPADENYAAVYSSSLSVGLSDKVMLSGSLNTGSNEPPVAGCSLRYFPGPHFFCRAGMSTSGTSYYGGIGLGWKNVRLEVSSSWHGRLGLTPGLSIEYRGAERKEAGLP